MLNSSTGREGAINKIGPHRSCHGLPPLPRRPLLPLQFSPRAAVGPSLSFSIPASLSSFPSSNVTCFRDTHFTCMLPHSDYPLLSIIRIVLLCFFPSSFYSSLFSSYSLVLWLRRSLVLVLPLDGRFAPKKQPEPTEPLSSNPGAPLLR